MHASNFLLNVFLKSTSKCRHIGGGDSQFTFFTQRENMRLSKEQSFIFYSVICSITDYFLFTSGWTSYQNSTLFNILLLCFLYFLFSFLFRYPFKQSTLLWKTSQIVCIRFKTRLFSYGYGIRYEYGIFTQKIKGTEQVSVLWFCFLTPFLNLMNILQSIYIALIMFYNRLKSLTIGCALVIPGRR